MISSNKILTSSHGQVLSTTPTSFNTQEHIEKYNSERTSRSDGRQSCFVFGNWTAGIYTRLPSRVMRFSVFSALGRRCRRDDILTIGHDQLLNPGKGDIFYTRLERSWGPPRLLYNGCRVIHGGKWQGLGVNYIHTPSSAEVKEKVYLYFPYVHSWQVKGKISL